MGRQQDRAAYPIDIRMGLTEKDLDDTDTELAKVRKAVDRMTWALVLAAVSFASSVALLAFQLIAGSKP